MQSNATLVVQKEPNYTILGHLGSGASAQVYKAMYNGKLVAVKVIKGAYFTKQREQEVTVFQDIQKHLARAKDENKTQTIKEGEYLIKAMACYHNSQLSIDTFILELASVGTLEEVTKKYNQPTEKWFTTVLKFSKDIFMALDFLHETGYLHRDIKPANILIDQSKSQNRWIAKLADFGLSIGLTESQNLSLKPVGTPLYIAPEVISAQHIATTKSDVYSTGLTFWKAATAQQVFPQASTRDDLRKLHAQNVKHSIPPVTPLTLTVLINSACHKDPNKRPTPRQVVEALDKSVFDANKISYKAK